MHYVSQESIGLNHGKCEDRAHGYSQASLGQSADGEVFKFLGASQGFFSLNYDAWNSHLAFPLCLVSLCLPPWGIGIISRVAKWKNCEHNLIFWRQRKEIQPGFSQDLGSFPGSLTSWLYNMVLFGLSFPHLQVKERVVIKVCEIKYVEDQASEVMAKLTLIAGSMESVTPPKFWIYTWILLCTVKHISADEIQLAATILIPGLQAFHSWQCFQWNLAPKAVFSILIWSLSPQRPPTLLWRGE